MNENITCSCRTNIHSGTSIVEDEVGGGASETKPETRARLQRSFCNYYVICLALLCQQHSEKNLLDHKWID